MSPIQSTSSSNETPAVDRMDRLRGRERSFRPSPNLWFKTKRRLKSIGLLTLYFLMTTRTEAQVAAPKPSANQTAAQVATQRKPSRADRSADKKSIEKKDRTYPNEAATLFGEAISRSRVELSKGSSTRRFDLPNLGRSTFGSFDSIYLISTLTFR